MTEKERERRYIARSRKCRDCRIDVFDIHHWYMVYDHVWAQAVPEYRENEGFCLCLYCLAERLGRPLRLDDFTLAPINRITETRLAILEAVTLR